MLLLGAAAVCGADKPAEDASSYLQVAMKNPARADQTLLALRSTNDKDLQPLLAAMSSRGKLSQRMFATLALVKIFGAEASDILLTRLRSDPVPTIRLAALAGLIETQAITENQLLDTVNDADGSIRCLSARRLAGKGRGALVGEALEELTRSGDLATVAIARMSLLAIGRTEHKPILEAMVADPNTPQDIVSLLLEQAAEDKITAAADMVRQVQLLGRSDPMRVMAYRTGSTIMPEAPERIAQAIRATDKIVFTIHLLEILSDRDDATEHLRSISSGTGPLAVLARFELARSTGGASAAQAISAALETGHPAVEQYILRRAEADISDDRAAADFYTDPLLEYIQSAPTNAGDMIARHIRAARAATALGNLGTSQAGAGMRKILAGRYDAVVRSAAAGLMHCDNPDVCQWMRPLLASPYEELATDAALTLGRFGESAAEDHLRRIVATADRQRPVTAALAAWYLLKMSDQARSTAKVLADQIK